MDLQLQDKVALVLGASRGLGRAIAQSLADEGAGVITVARSNGAPDFCCHIAADLDDPATPARIASEIRSGGKSLDILVLNSGGPPTGTAAATALGDFEAVFQRMFHAQIALVQEFLPAMRERGFGRIIVVASTSVIAPLPGLVLSNTVRAALASWCKTLASEVARDGVTVNLLLPGQIATDRLASLHQARAAAAGITAEEAAGQFMAAIPAARFGQPEEFGDIAAFLASPRAGFITGTAIKVDGGQTAAL